MRRLYGLVYLIALVLAAPYLLWMLWRRGGRQVDFGQRFGRYSSRFKQALTNRQVLWVHAVSVGEVHLCTQLIQALELRFPQAKVVVSTTTPTGMAELQRRLPSHIEKVYFPLDRRRWVCRAINVIHPEAVILVEAEIWPNFMWRLRERHVKAFLVNARLSERSCRRYRRLGGLFRPIFVSFAGVGVQQEADAARFCELGCRPEVVQVMGSLKYDTVPVPERRHLDVRDMLRRLGVGADAAVLVAGSTHPGEESLLGQVFLRLRARHPRLFLVVVPRHFERSREAGRSLAALGLRVAYRNAVTATTQHGPGTLDCLVVNTTGELRFFYEQATVVFVGKSLAAHGGQNPIEPAVLAKPVVFGPHMENFAAVAAAFVRADAALQVRDVTELEGALDGLLGDAERRGQLGANALRLVQENRGAAERTVDMIAAQLDEGELEDESRAGSA